MTLAEAEINLDMIVQNVWGVITGRTDISFTLRVKTGRRRERARQDPGRGGPRAAPYDDWIGKAAPIGAGMRTNPGVAARFFSSIAEAGVNIEMISTSEIRVSVVVDEDDVDAAVAAAHRAFDLDADEVEAVVYGGTGR